MAIESGSTPERVGPGRPPSLLDAIIPLLALMLLLGSSYAYFGSEASLGPNQIALLFCGLIAAGIGCKNGIPWSALRQATVDSVSSGLTPIFILLAVGALIATWAMSGTMVAMVYYGMKVLSPHYFYASAAIICAIVSTGIGSSWTTAGTVGLGLMGVAENMGLSPAIAAGAVISGAYFGNKISPLADTANLTSATVGVPLFEHIRETLWTSLPSLLLAILLFGFLGSDSDFDASTGLLAIEQHYNVSLWAFLPIVFVFGLAVLGFPPFVTIFVGALLGGVMAVLLNPDAVVAFAGDPTLTAPLAMLKGVWRALATGYVVNSGNPELDLLLSRGGMSSMLTTVWLIMTALAFGAILERAGLLERIIEPVRRHARSTGGLVAAVVASCIGVNIVASDQYIAIVLPGRTFRAEFARRGLAPTALSRAVSDSATVTSPLVPWNSCGAFMSATLGVPTLNYAGFAFLSFINPLATILVAILGLRMRPALATARDDSPAFRPERAGSKEEIQK